MTWHTSLGDRVLSGAEAALFREALTTCADWLEGDLDQDEAFHEFGIPDFDSVTPRGDPFWRRSRRRIPNLRLGC